MSKNISEKNNEEIELDERKLRRMQHRIFEEEKNNYKTRKYSRSKMVDRIYDILVKEHRKI